MTTAPQPTGVPSRIPITVCPHGCGAIQGDGCDCETQLAHYRRLMRRSIHIDFREHHVPDQQGKPVREDRDLTKRPILDTTETRDAKERTAEQQPEQTTTDETRKG